jgi:hypothetical protein
LNLKIFANFIGFIINPKLEQWQMKVDGASYSTFPCCSMEPLSPDAVWHSEDCIGIGSLIEMVEDRNDGKCNKNCEMP